MERPNFKKILNNLIILILFVYLFITFFYMIQELDLNVLNKNNNALSVLFSGIVAIATISYALLTWGLVHETKKMREIQTQPFISLNIEPRPEWINLIDLIKHN